MSFLYPRLISVFRRQLPPSGSAGFGAQGYEDAQTDLNSDISIWDTTPLYSQIQASVQQKTQGRNTSTDLPGDVKTTVMYRILIARETLPLGSLQARDFIRDDIGRKYHLVDPYWGSLGYNLFCMVLET